MIQNWWYIHFPWKKYRKYQKLIVIAKAQRVTFLAQYKKKKINIIPVSSFQIDQGRNRRGVLSPAPCGSVAAASSARPRPASPDASQLSAALQAGPFTKVGSVSRRVVLWLNSSRGSHLLPILVNTNDYLYFKRRSCPGGKWKLQECRMTHELVWTFVNNPDMSWIFTLSSLCLPIPMSFSKQLPRTSLPRSIKPAKMKHCLFMSIVCFLQILTFLLTLTLVYWPSSRVKEKPLW